MYTITLANGTEIDGLKLNGNNFISQVEIDPHIFSHNLSHVKIKSDNLIPSDIDWDSENIDWDKFDEEGACGEFDNLELTYFKQKPDGSFWFVLLPIDANRLENMKTNAKLEYVAMMSDIDID